MENTGSIPVFAYGDKEIQYLRHQDPILGKVIDQIGHIDRTVIPDLFEALVNSIVSQQISSKALATVWERITARCSPLTPAHIHSLPAEQLQSCGISMRKASYIKEAAARILDGRLDLHELAQLPDDQVRRILCELPGIGPWTAEMLLIFSLQRPDVLSCGDFGIRKGLCMVYGHDEITPQLFAMYQKRFSPYGTVAGLYLWAVAGGAPVAIHNPADCKS